MYSLGNFKPYAEASERRKDILEKLNQARATIADGQARLEGLEDRATEMAVAGNYPEFEKERDALQQQITQAGAESKALEAALVPVEKELGIQRQAARAIIGAKARKRHHEIVDRGICALEGLVTVLQQEQGLVEDLRPSLGPETGLPLLAWALPARIGQFKHTLTRIKRR